MLEIIQASNGGGIKNTVWYLLILNAVQEMNEQETWTITTHKKLVVPD